jgi:hypothetical protein
MSDQHITAKTREANRASSTMRTLWNTAATAMSLLLTQTTLAQETRESICIPVDLTVRSESVQLRCASEILDGAGIVRFFAVPTTNAVFAGHFLSTAKSAQINGKPVLVQYQTRAWSSEGPPSAGCEIKECRAAVAISIR